MKAITLQNKRYVLTTSSPKPAVRDDTILIRAVAWAINPSDTKTPIEGGAPDGTHIGIDAAGFVEAVGANATRQFKKGDKVAGFVVGNGVGDRSEGAFSEFTLIRTGMAFKIPSSMKFTDAVTLGCGGVTVALSLFQSLQLPISAITPGSEEKPSGKTVLIYGGNTSTGVLSIQYAKLAGWNVVATCSPANFDHLKSLGADATFDYKSPTCGADINEYTKNSLFHVHDCIGTRASAAICDAALSSSPSPDNEIYYCPLLPMRLPNRDEASVKGGFVLGYTAGGEDTRYDGNEVPAKTEDYKLVTKFWPITEELLASGKIKTHEIEVRTGGLRGVVIGIEDLKRGEIRGRKLVYKL